MEAYDLRDPLDDNLVAFLKENFNVYDIDALSDDDYDELYGKI